MTQEHAFPFYRFTGSHGHIGYQYGRICSSAIQGHLDKALTQLQQRAKATPAEITSAALLYRDEVMVCAPSLDEEIQGIARGAGISVAEAYVLQLRAELLITLKHQHLSVNECTTFAVCSEATCDGKVYAGQNADLPQYYTDYGVVVEFVPDNAPAVLMLAFAGQVSFIGVNQHGLGVFGNFLKCDGWRTSFPRYLLSRIVLSCEDVPSAISAVAQPNRGSSRNLLLVDSAGTAVDLETTPTRIAAISPDCSYFTHTNHFINPELMYDECATGTFLRDSLSRYHRMNDLFSKAQGQIDLAALQQILQDRTNAPDAICREPTDNRGTTSTSITVASVIADPKDGSLWISRSSPRLNPYTEYRLSA